MVYFLLFLIGAVFGSFYNVLIYRIPRGMSVVSPPSHCPSCKTPIKWYNNVPIISYILLKGRCSNCSAKISIRYPLVEAFSGFLAVICYYKWGLSFSALVLYIFFSILLVLGLIDWDTFSLPEPPMLMGTAFGLVSSVFREDFGFYDSLLGTVAGVLPFLLIYLYYRKIRGIEGLGFGDVELMALIGSFTGIWGVISAVFLGSLLGLVYVLPILIKHKSMNFVIPFGPFLALGCFVGVVFDGWRFFLTGS